MDVSICIATYNKPKALAVTLASIANQETSLEFEVIVVDDGSPRKDDRLLSDTYKAMDKLPGINVQCICIDRPPSYRNPAVARNTAYRAASGDVIIAMSDDVYMRDTNCLAQLYRELRLGTFVIATVINVDKGSKPYCDPKGPGYGDHLTIYTAPNKPRPLFFLGALYCKDLYAVGGNDEEFVAPSGEDQWFARGLMYGLGIKPYYSDVVGCHQHHQHVDPRLVGPSQKLLKRKTLTAQRSSDPTAWLASGGPWPYE